MNRLLAGSLTALALIACGGPAPTADGGCRFPSQPLLSQASDGGLLRISVWSCPGQPPPRGLDTFQYDVSDASGAPRDGLDVTVTTFMPEMGHGASVVPTVTPEGQGLYLVSDVYLFMTGEWQLQTTFAGPVQDHATFTFQVQ